LIKSEGDSDLVRLNICMLKNHGRSLSTPAFNAFPPQPTPQQLAKPTFIGGSPTAIAPAQTSAAPGTAPGSSGQAISSSLNLDVQISFRYLHTFRDNIDIVLIRLQRMSKRGRHPVIASAALYLSDIVCFLLLLVLLLLYFFNFFLYIL